MVLVYGMALHLRGLISPNEASFPGVNASQVELVVKNPPANAGDTGYAGSKRIRSLDGEDPMEEGIEKAIEFQKNIYFCFTDYAKIFVWTKTNCEKFFKR